MFETMMLQFGDYIKNHPNHQSFRIFESRNKLLFCSTITIHEIGYTALKL